MTTIDKKDRVLVTALNLFTAQGLQQTSMAQISKESGVAVGTIYLYFESKDELIKALFLKAKNNFVKAIELTDEEKETSLRNRFELIWRKAYKHYLSNKEEFMFTDTHNYSPLIDNQTREISRKELEYQISVFIEGIKKGVFRNMNIIVMLRFVYNSVVTMVQIKLVDEIEVTDEMIDKVVEMTWSAYLKR